jgi:hypothetical protein
MVVVEVVVVVAVSSRRCVGRGVDEVRLAGVGKHGVVNDEKEEVQ